MSIPFDIVFLGNYTKDTIVTPGETRLVDGGAMNYGSNAAVRMGLKTAVVTRLAQEDLRVVQKLQETGIACFPCYTPHSSCIRLDYPTTDPDLRTITVTSSAGSFTPGQLDGWEGRAVVVGASWRDEVPLEVIRALRRKTAFLAADMQGFVRVLQDRTLAFAPWQEMQAVLACLDVVKADMVEAEHLTSEKEIEKAALKFAAFGPHEIVLTHREGVCVYADGQFHRAGFYPTRLLGRSGRGDTCIGSYMAKRLSAAPAESTVWAAALTSLKMEAPRPFDRSIETVEDLIREKYA